MARQALLPAFHYVGPEEMKVIARLKSDSHKVIIKCSTNSGFEDLLLQW